MCRSYIRALYNVMNILSNASVTMGNPLPPYKTTKYRHILFRLLHKIFMTFCTYDSEQYHIVVRSEPVDIFCF